MVYMVIVTDFVSFELFQRFRPANFK